MKKTLIYLLVLLFSVSSYAAIAAMRINEYPRLQQVSQDAISCLNLVKY